MLLLPPNRPTWISLILFHLGIYDSKYHHPDLVERGRLWYLKSISEAQKSVRLMDSELNPQLIGDPRIIEAIAKASQKGVKVDIICGPLIITDPQGQNPIWSLHKQGKVKLYILPEERTYHHVLIVDNGEPLILEDYHAPGVLIPRILNIYWHQQGSIIASWINYFEKVKEEAIRPTNKDFIEHSTPICNPPELQEEYVRLGYSFALPQGESKGIAGWGNVFVR